MGQLAPVVFQHILPSVRKRLGMVLVWELHVRNGVSVLEHAGIPSGPVCLSMLIGVNVGPIYFTIILQSSVGRGEAHFWVQRPPRKSPPDLKFRRHFSESSDWIPVSGQYI